MRAGRRDLYALRIAIFGFLASVGLIAILAWLPTRYLAEWAVGPPPSPANPVFSDISVDEIQRMAKSDYRWTLADAAEAFATAAALHWTLVYLLGISRYRRPGRMLASPSLPLVAALTAAMAGAFLAAVPRLLYGPLIDSCTLHYAAAHPNDACIDCGIHRCMHEIGTTSGLSLWALVLGLMGVSLWLRWRLSRGLVLPAVQDHEKGDQP